MLLVRDRGSVQGTLVEASRLTEIVYALHIKLLYTRTMGLVPHLT